MKKKNQFENAIIVLLLNLLETIEFSLPKENKNAVAECGKKSNQGRDAVVAAC